MTFCKTERVGFWETVFWFPEHFNYVGLLPCPPSPQAPNPIVPFSEKRWTLGELFPGPAGLYGVLTFPSIQGGSSGLFFFFS